MGSCDIPSLVKEAKKFMNIRCTTKGVSHFGLAIYIIKKYLKAKEESWKFKYFSPCKNIIFKQIL
jgi:hypothetical protein